MSNDDSFVGGLVLGGAAMFMLSLLVGGCCVHEVQTNLENEAIRRGYGEMILSEGERAFRWKEDCDDQRAD